MRRFAVAALFAALSTGALAAPLATVNFSGDAAFNAASDGHKSIAVFRWGNDATDGAWEVALGNPTSSRARVQAQNDWSGGESFKLSYDGAGSLVLDFNGTSSFLAYPGGTKPAIDTTGFNALALRANGRRGDATIANLQFNGIDFGPLVADDVVAWLVLTGLDVATPWMLSGNIHFADSDSRQQNGGAAPSFQVRIAASTCPALACVSALPSLAIRP